MNKLFQSVTHVFKGALMAFKRYPTSIGCAAAFTIVTIVRIQLDWQRQEPYEFLFNCLQWSLALGAVVSLAAAVFAASRNNNKKTFVFSNLFGILITAVTFVLLFLLARSDTSEYQYATLTEIAQIRVSVMIFVSLILFIIFAGFQDNRFEFDLALFMTEKAFFISLIYGLVIFVGTSGIAAAVEHLIYSNMNEKVYMYIITLSGLISYMFFIGYFPDFTKGVVDPKREDAQRQPRFIEILFCHIMIPIVMALTLVLLIWTVQTVLSGMQVQLTQLYSIASAYTVGGLWLHAMTLRSEKGLVKAYRIVYPLASVIILVFEAWAVISQLMDTGLKTVEYVFILLWLLAFSGTILILIKKARAHIFIAIAACVLAVLAILPVIGYQALPVSVQVNRLENLLVSQNMLVDDTLSAAETEPEESVRIAITDAVYYLLDNQEANLPEWFDAIDINENSFEDVFGFKQIWSSSEDSDYDSSNDWEIYIYLSSTAMSLDGYDWVVDMQNIYSSEEPSVSFTGVSGDYTVYWLSESDTEAPVINIEIDGQVIIEQSLSSYFDELAVNYDLEDQEDIAGDLDNMSIYFETSSFDALLILNYVYYCYDSASGETYYWVEPDALYIAEK